MSDDRNGQRRRDRTPARPTRPGAPGRDAAKGPSSGQAPGGGAGDAGDAAGAGGGGRSGGSGGAAGGSGGGSAGGGRAPLGLLAAGVAAAAIALGAFFFLGGAQDSVSDAEKQTRQDAYAALVAGPGLPLTPVAPEEIDRAIEEMPETVSEEQRQDIRERVDAGTVRLAWLTLWDTHAEDGDILRFESSASFPIDVTALNAKTTIAIPYPPEGAVQVTGMVDGGGGITIALESGATQIAWPTMAPGDTLRLPVTPGF